jgi:hypothetical protein
MIGARQVERCLSLFINDGAVLVERPLGGSSSVTEVPLETVPALLAERFGLAGVSRGPDGRFCLPD